jgi:hypothetical protein
MVKDQVARAGAARVARGGLFVVSIAVLASGFAQPSASDELAAWALTLGTASSSWRH